MDIDSKTRFFLAEVRHWLGGPDQDESALLQGCAVGGYRLGALLGVGGSAVVFEATGPDGEERAVKVLPRPSDADTKSLALFKREVEIGRSIEHPAVLKTYHAFDRGSALFVVMERAHGSTLREVLNREKLSVANFLTIFRGIAEGLHAAHLKGVVHRDLKPENIMVYKSSEVKILDFGLARNRSEQTLTETGQFKGTFTYCSPEQVQDSSHVDHLSDQFAFGVMCFEALTGLIPFPIDEGNPLLTLLARVDRPALRLTEVDPFASERAAEVLAKMMAVKPSRRFSGIDLAFSSLAQSLP